MRKNKPARFEDKENAHKRCVFNDFEFFERLVVILNRAGVRGGSEIGQIREGGEIKIVILDERGRTYFPKHSVNELKHLVNDYAVDIEDVVFFFTPENSGPNRITPKSEDRVTVSFSEERGVNVAVKPGATKQDVIGVLDVLELMMKQHYGSKKTKHKPPHHYNLVYAIFRARAKNQKFSKIFSLYEKGELPLYENESKIQFKSEDSLERYYRKYKPKAAS